MLTLEPNEVAAVRYVPLSFFDAGDAGGPTFSKRYTTQRFSAPDVVTWLRFIPKPIADGLGINHADFPVLDMPSYEIVAHLRRLRLGGGGGGGGGGGKARPFKGKKGRPDDVKFNWRAVRPSQGGGEQGGESADDEPASSRAPSRNVPSDWHEVAGDGYWDTVAFRLWGLTLSMTSEALELAGLPAINEPPFRMRNRLVASAMSDLHKAWGKAGLRAAIKEVSAGSESHGSAVGGSVSSHADGGGGDEDDDDDGVGELGLPLEVADAAASAVAASQHDPAMPLQIHSRL